MARWIGMKIEHAELYRSNLKIIDGHTPPQVGQLSVKRINFQQLAESLVIFYSNTSTFFLKVEKNNHWQVGQAILLSVLPAGTIILYVCRSSIQQIY
jgi:hypothetical protein